MRLQFRTSTFLLSLTAGCIYLAGVLARAKYEAWGDSSVITDTFYWRSVLTYEIPMSAPLFVPAIFLAYMLGRRSISPWAVLAMAVAEAVAVACLHLVPGEFGLN